MNKKTIIRKLLVLFIFGLNLIIATAQKTLVESNNEFTFNIYQATKIDTSNLFISPFGLFMALSVVNEGAAANTRTEIDKLLCLEPSLERADSYHTFLNESVDLRRDSTDNDCITKAIKNNKENELLLANSVWYSNKLKLNEVFTSQIQTKYSTELFSFNTKELDAANQQLKKWISDKTRNKITNIADLEPESILSILNTIYFNGEWEYPFDKEKTSDDVFKTIIGEDIRLNFMHYEEDLQYYADSSAQCVFIPYKCYQFSIIVVLPHERFGLLDIEKNLDPDKLKEIERFAYTHKVYLSLPKFNIESEINARDAIINMGFTEMFSDEADFSKISSSKKTKIDNIIQKTFITVDEEKTEAAAVTKVDMLYIGQLKEVVFNANHPFLFLIMDNRTKAIIFMGRYVK